MDYESIVQLATPRALSAIHIIRLSGSDCGAFLKRHFPNSNLTPRRAYHKSFIHKKKTIDRLLVIYFKAPHSYTGEDMVELHCHGSLAITDELLQIAIQGRFRLAKPGEFTYRGFVNGKISLEESEAIDTLIKSQSSRSRENALNILEQKTSLKFKDIENDLFAILAELTSVIEFPEEDIPEIETEQTERYQNYLNKCRGIETHFQTIYNNYLKGKKIEDGIKVVLVGSPNAGKSTLMNLLLRDNRSIVSPIKGTTRDYVKETFNLGGFPLELIDTAGIRKAGESIEQMGIEKSTKLIKQANIIIWLVSAEEISDLDAIADLKTLKDTLDTATQENPELVTLIYLNKIDLLDETQQAQASQIFVDTTKVVCRTLSLIDNPQNKAQSDRAQTSLVEDDLKAVIEKMTFSEGHNLALLNERQAVIAEQVINQLKKIIRKLKQFESEEIILEDFQSMANLLREINIDLQHENIFDQLFSKFCLGK